MRQVIVSKSIKQALVQLARENKCDRIAILKPSTNPESNEFQVLRVIDKSGRVINPSTWYQGLTAVIDATDILFRWMFVELDWKKSKYSQRFYVTERREYTYESKCPPINRQDGYITRCEEYQR